ncbi:MAG: peptidoglycan DD-metalloendopeptidase family protein [Bacteroidetes bacterium]|nr:peptidoglycan DD-metalloendopeptidase family protein [Bacteroidota bacterium]
MKKYYYFSENSLAFVELKSFKSKLIIYISLTSLLFTTLLFGGYFFISSVTNTRGDLASVKNENRYLESKLIELTDKYETLQLKLIDLGEKTENLRIAANLEPISADERLLGVGGGSFDNSLDFLITSNDLDLEKAIIFIDNITNKFEFERLQYKEIASKMKTNMSLFESIPAMVPTKGDYIGSRFGIRIHPILKIRKMHTGIDFVVNTGAPVYSPGRGKVVYIGRNGGYGLEMEIDHGFGYRTRYAHLSKVLVKRGQKIMRGDVIAKTGNSGLSTGPHLHYEISHNGRKLNPSRFFFDDLGFIELTQKK